MINPPLMHNPLHSIAIVIPVLDPDKKLRMLIRELRKYCSNPVIVVNDGSRTECLPLFEELAAGFPELTVLHHKNNQGKGCALKTAFLHYLEHWPDGTGTVCCDADGQHPAEDVVRGIRELSEHPECLVLGCRDFSGQGIPEKCRWGNIMTGNVLEMILKRKFADTQTGLRGVPRDFMAKLLELSGARYEFETLMLLTAAETGRTIIEYPIRTIYQESNRGSHFKPVTDSLRICASILKHMLSSRKTNR